MKKFYKKYKKAFTLIELLVVISIVSLLSSIIFASVNETRAKARDSKKIQEVSQVKTALNLYHENVDSFPGTAGERVNEGTVAYNNTMQELVDGGVLGGIPDSPDDTYSYILSDDGNYAFFNTVLENSNNAPSGSSPNIIWEIDVAGNIFAFLGAGDERGVITYIFSPLYYPEGTWSEFIYADDTGLNYNLVRDGNGTCDMNINSDPNGLYDQSSYSEVSCNISPSEAELYEINQAFGGNWTTFYPNGLYFQSSNF